MKPKQIELLLKAAAVVTVITASLTGGTPIPLKEDQMQSGNDSDETNIGRPRISTCLRIAPNLPPCNFDFEATWRSNSGELLREDPAGSGYPVAQLPDYLNDESGGNVLTVEDGTPTSTGDENRLGITLIYYLEGCLPSRLPFDLPSCRIDESKIIQMNKLVPFQLPGVEDALIFPEIDVKQIEFYRR